MKELDGLALAFLVSWALFLAYALWVNGHDLLSGALALTLILGFCWVAWRPDGQEEDGQGG